MLYARAMLTTKNSFTIGIYHENNGTSYEHTIRFLGSYNFIPNNIIQPLTIEMILLTQNYFDRKCRELYTDSGSMHECYDILMEMCKEYDKNNFSN